MEANRCALLSCYSLNPRLYDERVERYFCDIDCFTEFVAENPEEFADYYARLNIHIIEEDVKHG